MWKETRFLTLGKQFLRYSIKTRAMVNSTSGTKRATEMGPVHLICMCFFHKFEICVVFFLFAICTIQCILSTLAWVPMQTSFNIKSTQYQY